GDPPPAVAGLARDGVRLPGRAAGAEVAIDLARRRPVGLVRRLLPGLLGPPVHRRWPELVVTAGSRSANQKPSRKTRSPSATASGRANIGPAEQNVWNSPRSPHGSTLAGRSASNAASKRRPTKVPSSWAGSTQVRTASRPLAIISRARPGVS